MQNFLKSPKSKNNCTNTETKGFVWVYNYERLAHWSVRCEKVLSMLMLDSEERKVLSKIQQESNAALAIQNSLELNVLLNKYKPNTV